MSKAYDEIKRLDAEVLAVHVECSPPGTALTVQRNGIRFPMANDDRLNVVTHYSPTSTYVIGSDGVIRARWLDQIHKRVGAGDILAELRKLEVRPSAR